MTGGEVGRVNVTSAVNALPGQLRGRATDAKGDALPGVTVVVQGERGAQQTAVTGADGTFALSGVPEGLVTVTSQRSGFASANRSFYFDRQSQQVDLTMPLGALSETVTLSGQSPAVDSRKARSADREEQLSQNVINLQRKTAGVLPVRVDVPRAGTSHQFVKPLVVDQAASVSFKYKRR
jgi:hypothetical protein